MDKNKMIKILEIFKEEKLNDNELLAKLFFSYKKINRYILGRNQNSINLASYIQIDGFIDDFSDLKEWQNKPIYKSYEIEKENSIIISCSLAIYPHTAINNLKRDGFPNILDYMELVKYSNKLNLDVEFVDDAKKDIEINFDKYNAIYNTIEETESKRVYSNLINFRANRNLNYLKEYKVDEIGQYFEDFLDLKEGEVFIDAGGYDGQTSIEFIKHCPKYKSIYIFEPDSENIKLAKNNLKNFKNVSCISKGLSNQKDTLKFDTGSGSASSISESGTIEIEVDTLDNLVDEKVSFIKMDIEGAEGLAIEGMRNHILNDYPKMAISVYHKVDDLWKIPEQIFAIRGGVDYDVYLRHYTEGTDETVMFFMPKK